MRQAGIIAAGALYAVECNRDRLVEDHVNAQVIATAVGQAEGLSLRPDTVDTNIVIFEVDPALGTAGQFAAALKSRGVWMLAVGATLLRAVTHLDVNDDDVRTAAEIIRKVADDMAHGRITISNDEPTY